MMHFKQNFFNKKALECLIVFLLLIISLYTGMNYIKENSKSAQFYQTEFAPAVSFACGKGFNNYKIDTVYDFLTQKSASVDCSVLKTEKPVTLNLLQLSSRYLITSVALSWKLSGISWQSTYPLFAILFAMSILGLYGIFRLGVGIILSLFGISLIWYSGLLLSFLPQLRDFSPAAFILPSIFFCGLLAKKSFSPPKTIIVSILLGLLIGVGFGFRTDLSVFAMIPFIVILFFLPTKLTERRVLTCFALLSYLVIFISLASPIFISAKDNNFFHVILLGYAPIFNTKLFVKSSLYTILYKYNDAFLLTVLRFYGNVILHSDKYITLATPTYNAIGANYYWLIIKNFPADYIMRIYASILAVLNLPYISTLGVLGLTSYSINLFYFYISTLSITIIIAGLTFLRSYSFKIALFVLLAVLSLGAYPVLQFSPRHYFYLEFVSIWMLLLVISCFFKVLSRKVLFENISVKQTIIFLLAPLLLLTGLLYASRTYQIHHLKKLFNHYDNADVRRITNIQSQHDGYNIWLTLPKDELAQTNTYAEMSDYKISVNYLVLDLKNTCDLDSVLLNFKYSVKNSYSSNLKQFLNFSYITQIFISGNTKVFFPIYNSNDSDFAGILLPDAAKNCIAGIYTVKNPAQYPLLIPLVLQQNWRDQKLYEQLNVPEKTYEHIPEVFHLAPENVKVPPSIWTHVTPGELTSLNEKYIKKTNNRIMVRGFVKKAHLYRYIASLNSQNITKEQLQDNDIYYVGKGTLTHGGFSLGLLRDNKWDPVIAINEENYPFAIVIKLDHVGNYTPVIANNLPGSMENNFEFNKIGWVFIPKNKSRNYSSATRNK